MKKLFIFLVAFGFFLEGGGTVKAATTYHLTCADFPILEGVSCASDTLTWADNTGADVRSTGYFGIGTWYVSYTVTGGNGKPMWYAFYHLGNSTDTNTSTGSVTSELLVSDKVTGELYLNSTVGLSSPFFTGDISNICVTDTAGDCEPPPPPPASWEPDGAFQYSTTTQVIDNPAQDIFMGFVGFFFSMWFMIWLFRRT
jgi:hypothetical protein